MNLKKIHHVAIIVSDYKKSRAFYVENFDYPEKPLKYKHIRRISD